MGEGEESSRLTKGCDLDESKITASEVDRLTRVLDFVAIAHLPFVSADCPLLTYPSHPKRT